MSWNVKTINNNILKLALNDLRRQNWNVNMNSSNGFQSKFLYNKKHANISVIASWAVFMVNINERMVFQTTIQIILSKSVKFRETEFLTVKNQVE